MGFGPGPVQFEPFEGRVGVLLRFAAFFGRAVRAAFFLRFVEVERGERMAQC